MTKHYLNTTNGIEYLSEVKATGEPYSFLRIQSTTLERKDYLKLLGDLDHDFLMHLALGFECVVYDCGTNRICSKSIYSGIEIIRYVLNKYWYGVEPDFVPKRCRNGLYTHTQDMKPYFDSIYNSIFVWDQNKDKERIKHKLKYYKKYLNADSIDLTGISKSTIHDGDYKFYRELLINQTTL